MSRKSILTSGTKWINNPLGFFRQVVWVRCTRMWNVFVYTSLYITSIAVVETWLATRLLGFEANVALVIIGLVTYSVYMNDRIADVETDSASNPMQAEFVRRHRTPLFVVATGAYGLAVMLAVVSGPTALLLTLLPGVFWVFYALDYFDFVSDGLDRLKEVIVLNTMVVATAWAVTVTFLPVIVESNSLPLHVWPVLAYFFLRDFVHTEVPNVPDRFGDAQIGVSTIPSRYGLVTTRRVLYGINILTLVLVAVIITDIVDSQTVLLILIAGLCYSCCAVGLIGRWSREDLLGKVTHVEYVLVFVAISI